MSTPLGLPAICTRCGSMFTSGFATSGPGTMYMTDATSGPCPNCGGLGRIPDGAYRTVGQALEFLAPIRDTDSLRRLAEALRQAKEHELTAQQVAKAISTAGPQFSALQDILPQDRNQLYTFVTMIISALALLVSIYAAKSDAPTPSITQIFNTITQEKPTAMGSAQKTPTPGRNDPCYCASGKKFKHCHGKATR